MEEVLFDSNRRIQSFLKTILKEMKTGKICRKSTYFNYTEDISGSLLYKLLDKSLLLI